MIHIDNKENCVGCHACIQICPKQCISMHEDDTGFNYPEVNVDSCIDCHLCERVCPTFAIQPERNPIASYSTRNVDKEIRLKSSSGGAFYSLASYTIEHGGVVFGAKFDENWIVKHSHSETGCGIEAFMGSKYVQSSTCGTYTEVKQFLLQGRLVLFSGTPCQVSALKLFLRKDYANLLTVEVACHGVPSPKMWKQYLHYISEKHSITNYCDISFRNKRIGWQNYRLLIQHTNNQGVKKRIIDESFRSNVYMQSFLKDLDLRPSCFACPAKHGKSGADIALADFWGIQRLYPELYDTTGVSLVLAYSDMGNKLIHNCSDLLLTEVDYNLALSENPALIENPVYNSLYRNYWKVLDSSGIEGIKSLLKTCRPPVTLRAKNALKQTTLRILGAKGNLFVRRLLARTKPHTNTNQTSM